MLTVFEYLSGEVPGGLPLLLALLLAIHLTFSMLRKSDLISRKKAIKSRIISFSVVLLFYFTLWTVLQPPLPRVRIVVLPVVGQNGKLPEAKQAFAVPEFFKRLSIRNLENKYILHRWEWAYETLQPDSVNDYRAWKNLARHLEPGILIEGRQNPDGDLELFIQHFEEKESLRFSPESASFADLSLALRKWPASGSVFLNPEKTVDIPDNYISMRISLLEGKPGDLPAELPDSADPELVTLYAFGKMKQGLQQDVDRERIQYTGFQNRYFEESKKLVYPLIRARKDPPMVALILGRIAIWEERFEDADVFFKKALADDPLNSRIYYYLSSLLPVRLHELGFESRIDVLEQAVDLDPGYADAVHALAREYYLSGSGSQTGTGTTNAIRLMENFLQMQPNNPKILSLLATTYLQTQRQDEAMTIYEKLEKRFPDDSNLYYNKGIVYFQKREYRQAIDNFLKAISIDQNLDAYLYAGLTYRMMGENDSALYYYRERVRRKTGDDDTYAKEAMAGIRIILEEMERSGASGEPGDAR